MLLRSRVIIVLALATTSCGALGRLGRGKASEAPRALTGFDTVEVTGVPVEIVVGPDAAVEGARELEVRVQDHTLMLTRRASADGVRVRVTVPELRRLAVTGSEVSVSGLAGGRVAVEATERGRVILEGAADAVDFVLESGSRGDARRLKVRTATVRLDGASRLDLRPDRAVSGEAKGASKLAMWSRPKRVGVATHDKSTISYVH
jgi:hypothetical protein